VCGFAEELRGRKGAVLVLVLVYGLGIFLMQGYRMPMFIVMRRK
jgi:hypothetical protein